MRRGFKAEAERISERIRDDMGLSANDPLDSAALAAHVGLEVRSASDLVDLSRLEALETLQPGAFSACTFEIGPRSIIVWNPLASAARRQSDIAHEVAHLLLHHSVKHLVQMGDFTFFSCDPDEEQEANWLAGCLLLPRKLLSAIVRRTTPLATLAREYGVSLEMLAYRLRATGVLMQANRRQALR